ncbi:Aldo/keto reductase [Wolfiporia cocos MD-104 SS10]|uniref:Aldo/keto reductase n=1 Tax=Wolfiporia cocos (strain MD-104) TaxID=742152 RepID=A0A2H3IYP4_WOLCO|nr:Aldo/keto reductase [Wolfiporia cocos MD-104 SS10]
MPASKFVKLNTGALMPTLGLGTWKSAPGAVEKAVEVALKNGYRHIDTAQAYENEREVGLGIKNSGVPREEIFLTTKLNNSRHRDPEVALEDSLAALDTPYLDLWLMHWPCPMKSGRPDREVNWLNTWKKMEQIYKAHPENVRAIGVSNISIKYFQELLAVAEVVPAVNQIESHPSLTQEELVQFCISKGISVTAYSPLGSDNAPLARNAVVQQIAKAHGVNPTTILISFHANRPEVTVIPKSVTPERIISNMTIVDLSASELQELKEIEKTSPSRVCKPFWTGYGAIGFPDCE